MASSSASSIATVLEDIVAEVKNQLFEPTVLLDAMVKTGGVKERTGVPIKVPAIVNKHSTIINVSSPSATLSANHTDPLQYLLLDYEHLATDIILDEVSYREAQGDAAKVDLWQTRVEEVLQDFRDKVNLKIVGNVDADGIFSKLITFNGMTTSGTGTSTGIFESAASNQDWKQGGQDNTIGGLSKATYPAYSHQWQTAGANYATNGRFKLELLISKCQKFAGKKPDLVLMSQKAWGLQRSVNSNTERVMIKAGTDDQAFSYGSFSVMGVPVDFDIALDTNNAAASTTDLISAYVLDFKTLYLAHLPGCWFEVGEKESYLPSRSLSQGAPVRLSLQVVPPQLSSQGVLVNGEA